MELFTRLINEGFFAYWNDDKNGDSYVVKLYILNADKKSELFSEEITGNRHCFSVDKLGSGEYQVEVSSFLQGQLIETVNKKVNLLSTAQKLTEVKDAIDGIRDAIENVRDNTTDIKIVASKIANSLSDLETKTSGTVDNTAEIVDVLVNFPDYFNRDSWRWFIKWINRDL